MENIYARVHGMVYQQVKGIPFGTNSGALIADLFYSVMRGTLCLTFTKSKRYYLIAMFNDTSRYLDDIFTINNPEFEKKNS